MKKSGDYYVIVVEDTNLGQIVATATLIIEHKFIHSCAKVIDLIFNYYILNTYFAIFIVQYYILSRQRGRVEEVVVSDVCRGKQLGKLWVWFLETLLQ